MSALTTSVAIVTLRKPQRSQTSSSRHSNIIGLLCGHVHWPVECDWAGTQARIMPSVAVDLRKGIDEIEAREQPIYLLHRLTDEIGIVSQPRRVGAN